jgi:phage terminase small subunit
MLNEKQKRFCQEYLIDFNATQAAIRAGYREKSAYSIGHDLLKKPEVKNYISKLQEETATRNNITTDHLVNEFLAIAKDDLKNYLDFTPSRKGIRVTLKKNIMELDTKNIERLQVFPNGSIRIKLYSRHEALVQLGRHVGFFNDKLTLQSNIEEILSGVTDAKGLTEDHLRRLAQLIFDQYKNFSHG